MDQSKRHANHLLTALHKQYLYLTWLISHRTNHAILLAPKVRDASQGESIASSKPSLLSSLADNKSHRCEHFTQLGPSSPPPKPRNPTGSQRPGRVPAAIKTSLQPSHLSKLAGGPQSDRCERALQLTRPYTSAQISQSYWLTTSGTRPSSHQQPPSNLPFQVQSMAESDRIPVPSERIAGSRTSCSEYLIRQTLFRMRSASATPCSWSGRWSHRCEHSDWPRACIRHPMSSLP
jgi:hypothetical protein